MRKNMLALVVVLAAGCTTTDSDTAVLARYHADLAALRASEPNATGADLERWFRARPDYAEVMAAIDDVDRTSPTVAARSIEQRCDEMAADMVDAFFYSEWDSFDSLSAQIQVLCP